MADWNAIREEYITGSSSQRELAKKHNVSQASINRRCRSEKWDDSRESFRLKVNQKTEESAIESHADRVALLLSGGEKAARLLLKNLDDMEKSGEINPYAIKVTVEAMRGIRDLYKADDGAPDAKLQRARELLGGVPNALDG